MNQNTKIAVIVVIVVLAIYFMWKPMKENFSCTGKAQRCCASCNCYPLCQSDDYRQCTSTEMSKCYFMRYQDASMAGPGAVSQYLYNYTDSNGKLRASGKSEGRRWCCNTCIPSEDEFKQTAQCYLDKYRAEIVAAGFQDSVYGAQSHYWANGYGKADRYKVTSSIVNASGVTVTAEYPRNHHLWQC